MKTFPEIEVLKSLKIMNLDLTENPICKLEDYRDKIFSMLHDLQVLDGLDRDGNEAYSEDDEEEEEDEDEEAPLGDEDDEENEDEAYDDDAEYGEDDDDYDDEEDDSDVGGPNKRQK